MPHALLPDDDPVPAPARATVNHILKANHGKRVAIIENEFGEVGVDDGLVVETKEEIFEMNNGCICCTVRGDLIRILGKLLNRRERFDAIVIETTGLADPAPVAQTFFVDDELKEQLYLDAILTVADAKHLGSHLDEVKPEGVENESVEQVAFADKILLNKVDLVTPQEKLALVDKIRGINSRAAVIECVHARVDVGEVLGIRAFDLSVACEFDEEFLDVEGEHRHDETVTSVGIRVPGAMVVSELNAWLTSMLRTKGTDIFRSKGILRVAGSDERVVFQGVHMTMEMASSANGKVAGWKEGETRESRFIFIGRNLDREELTEGFRACVAPE